MLIIEDAVGGSAGVVGLRIAVAIQQVAAMSRAAAAVAGGLGRGGAVIDNPELAEFAQREDDLIQLRVVVDAVAMRPILGRPGTSVPVDT